MSVYALLYMRDFALCWHLLWDRRYGPDVQHALATEGLTDEVCAEIADRSRAELRGLRIDK